MPVVYVPPEPPPPPPRSWPRPIEHAPKRVVWESAEGDELDLSDPSGSYWCLTGREGLGMPGVELEVDRVGNGAGLVRDVRTSPRLISLPLLVRGDDPEEYLAAYGRLQRALRHRVRGRITPGRLRVEMPTGQRRSIRAYYNGGLDPLESDLDDMISLHQAHPSLELMAPEPYWEGPEVTRRWRVASPAVAFYPIYSIQLTTSQVGDVRDIPAGDAPSYPVWRFTGPASSVRVWDDDTQEEFSLGEPIPAGLTVTVDCRPVELAPETGLTAVDSQDEDWWPHLEEFPSLFRLQPDSARVGIEMADASDDSLIELSYRPRWHAAWGDEL